MYSLKVGSTNWIFHVSQQLRSLILNRFFWWDDWLDLYDWWHLMLWVSSFFGLREHFFKAMQQYKLISFAALHVVPLHLPGWNWNKIYMCNARLARWVYFIGIACCWNESNIQFLGRSDMHLTYLQIRVILKSIGFLIKQTFPIWVSCLWSTEILLHPGPSRPRHGGLWCTCACIPGPGTCLVRNWIKELAAKSLLREWGKEWVE